ncbi:MAG: hypothetical protein VKL60_16265 [Sphaerospermopsis sp.]|nr:hypothetical protein [Sphaerospermopsis sp.]
MEIQKQIDELTFEKWRFTFMDGSRIYLDGYSLLQKESKRHKTFKVLKYYDRLSSRDSTMLESEVPFTDELKQQALSQFVSKIKVLRWSERSIA